MIGNSHLTGPQPVAANTARDAHGPRKNAKPILAALALSACVLLLPEAAAQTSADGSDLWQTVANGGKGCAGCHGATPGTARANAAGSSGNVTGGASIIAAAVGNNAETGMGSISLSQTQRESLSLYIESVVNTTPLAVSVSFNTAKTQSLTGKIYMDTSATLLNVLETDPADVPNKGTVSYDDDSSPGFTYTPTTGQCGSDTFKYRARRSSTGTVTSSRTVNITIASPGNTDITNASNTKNGTYGTFLSYTITASNSPLSYSHSGTLPPGITRSGATFSGTPTAVGQWVVTMSATNCTNTDNETLTFNIDKDDQTVTIPSQGTVLFRPNTQYTITGTTATSGLSSFTYASLTPSICTIASGATINKLAAGTCTVTATQAGNANYNPATSPQRNIVISKAAQTIDFPTQSPASRAFTLTPFTITQPATATSGLAVTYTSDTTGTCTVSGTSVTMVAAGVCTLRANQDGDTNWNPAPDQTEDITLTATLPNPPTGVAASPGDTLASVTFTAPANNGGMPITGYTATCTAAGQTTRTGTAASSPITVLSLVNGITYACTVVSTTGAGSSAASSSANVTPTAAQVAPAFTSVASTTFAINAPGTYNLTASGVPAPTFSHVGGTLPTGLSLSAAGVLSGTVAMGTTAGVYSLTFRATNAAGHVDQAFSLTVNKAGQSISFPNPGTQAFSPTAILLSASATSGLAVTLTVDPSATSVCGVSGNLLTTLSVGQCVIAATQAGDGNYNQAKPIQRTFSIIQGTQTINFPAQTPATRPFVPGTFPLSPVGTASSGLPVTHKSATSAVCTISGTTITIVDVGTCTITALQFGDANYLEAAEVERSVTIGPANQSITFAPTQAAQNYVPSGTFALAPVASASSGLPVVYSSNTQAICTVLDTTVTIVTPGSCVIAADQPGNTQFNAAATATRSIAITAVVPGAPTIGTATPGNGQAVIAFDPPASDGGSPITAYTATCNPGGVTGTGAESPITVAGLTNNVLYTCSVTATNAAGTGSASATVTVTPAASTGAALWTNTCSACHGPQPAGLRFNAAGATSTVLSYVRANQPSMALTPSVQALSTADLEALSAYIAQHVPNINVTTAVNTPRTVSVASHLTLNTISFTSVEIVSGPANGTLSPFAGRNTTYTPNPGFTGVDSFTYRGRRNSPASVLGDIRTVVINVTASTLPLTISPTGTGFGNVNSAPFGISCGFVCSEVYAPGTSITLTAVPEEGFGFGGWSGVSCAAGNANPVCTFTLNTATTVSVAFTDDPATPDFNADTRPDLLWRHVPSGSLYVWYMNGPALISDQYITNVDPSWKLDGVADFNGDGHPDIVWRNGAGDTYVWYLVSGVFQSDAFLFSLPPEWVIQGIADFNADGKPDFLMRNINSGNAFAWFFNNNIAVGDQFLFTIDPAWKVEGVADLNADGQPDLLFRNMVSGLAFAWNTQFSAGSLSLTTSSPAMFGIDPAWEIVQVADWNADGKPDLVFRNKNTGVVFVWYMDGTALTTSDFITQIDPSWEIVPRR